MSAFDVNAFIAAPVGPVSTEYETIPDAEYLGIIDSTDVTKWFGSVNRDDGSIGIVLSVPFVILDDKLKETMGRPKVTTRLQIWLDFEADMKTLQLGKGKNVKLGQLKEALGQNNDPNWSWALLPGAGPVKITTKTVTSKKDGARYSEVSKVALAA